MGDCADITGETADIVLSAEDGLLGLYKTRVLGSLLMEKIDRNNRNIVAVNTSLMFLGLLGFVSPSLAALLHNASTIAFSLKAMQSLLPEVEPEAQLHEAHRSGHGNERHGQKETIIQG